MALVLSRTCANPQGERNLERNLLPQSPKRNLLNQTHNRARKQPRRATRLRPLRPHHPQRLRNRRHAQRPAGKAERRNTEPNSFFAIPALVMNESLATCLITRSARTQRPSSSQHQRERKKQTAFTRSRPRRMAHPQPCSTARENTSDSRGTKKTL